MSKEKILQNKYTVQRIRQRRKARQEALLAAQALVRHKPGRPGKDDLQRVVARRMRRLDVVFGHRAERVHNAIQQRAIAAWRSR